MEVQNGICYQSINGLTKKNSTKMKIAIDEKDFNETKENKSEEEMDE